MTGVWIGLAIWKLWRGGNRKRVSQLTALAMLLVTIGFNALPIQNVEATDWEDWNYVDCLLVSDEELEAIPGAIDNCESRLAELNELFADFKIKFFNRGWHSWDSTDPCTNLVLLYWEAINETCSETGLPTEWSDDYGWGFSGGEWTDTDGNMWFIDLLLIFTGQWYMDAHGISVTWCNATITHYDSLINDDRLLNHEGGHQYIDHCFWGLCLMWDPPSSDYFCSHCHDELMASRDKWTTDVHDLTTTNTGNGLIDISEVTGTTWVTPTGHEETSWIWKEDAYDDDKYTSAGSGWIQLDCWGNWLILTHEEIDYVNNIKWLWSFDDMQGRRIVLDIDVYNGEWHDVHQLEYTKSYWEWHDCPFDPISGVTKVRLRGKATNAGSMNWIHMMEVDFGDWDSELGTYAFLHNTNLDIKATPTGEYIFDHWDIDNTDKGSSFSSSENPCTLILDGNYEIKATFRNPPHDVAVTDITLSSHSATPGESIDVEVTIENQGEHYETFYVLVYADRNTGDLHYDIGNENVSLNIEESKLLEFEWNTSAVLYGSYEITAEFLKFMMSPRPGRLPRELLCWLKRLPKELLHRLIRYLKTRYRKSPPFFVFKLNV